MEPLKNVIRNVKAKKNLGQNFLTDTHILQRIVKAAGDLSGRTIIEVGPGPGGLTREIIKAPCRELILIEQDARWIPYLEDLKAHFKGKFSLLHTDALEVSAHTLGDPPRKIIANLPYNVSVPLLLGWLQHLDDFESLTLMFQKEVASRLTASPNTPNYGRLSVMAQWKAHIRKLFDLAPGAFFPPPKVTSTVVEVTPRLPREKVSWSALEAVTKAAFSQRRKMLRSSLRNLLPFPDEVLKKVEINPEKRAENLTIQDFCNITKVWEDNT